MTTGPLTITISKAITDFAGVFDAARAELYLVIEKIEGLEGERGRVERAQPHTDDIVAVFERGLNAAAQGFEQQFRSRLEQEFVGEGSAEAAAKGKFANILRLQADNPDSQTLRDHTMRSKGPYLPGLNIEVLTFLLKDRIAEEIPALVEKLCPAARKGMRAADRAEALTRIDGELAQLRQERSVLEANLDAARRAVRR